MQTASFIFIVVFSLFSIAMGLAWLSHDARARLRSAGSTAGGLLLLGYAAFVAYPEISKPDPQLEIRRLREQVEQRANEATELQRTAAALRAQNASLEENRFAALTAERQRQAVVLDRLNGIEIERTPPRAGAAIVTGAGVVPARTTDNEAAHRSIEIEIEQLRQRLSRREAPAAPANTDSQKELMQLRDRMAGRIEAESYSVELYPDKEVVRGQPGRYYAIDMKDAKSGIRFQFEGGKYTLSRSSAEFRTALSSFVGDIMQKLHGNVRYDLYVRGSADRVPYRGRLEPGFEFARVRYMKAVSSGKYAGEFAERRINADISNEDLPQLRAAFLQTLVSDVYPTKPPVILEGSVSPDANVRDRNVELLLFVDW